MQLHYISSLFESYVVLHLASLFIVVTVVMSATGQYRHPSGPDNNPSLRDMVICKFIESGSIVTTLTDGSTAGLVVITFERYLMIARPLNYRKYIASSWTVGIGLVLPWLDGIFSFMIPNMATSKVYNGVCKIGAFWPTASMAKVYSLYDFP